MPTIKTTPNPVDAGSELTIAFTGGTPNSSVELTLDNDEGTEDTVTIELGANGEGETIWTVPETGWDSVIIKGGGADQDTVAVRSS